MGRPAVTKVRQCDGKHETRQIDTTEMIMYSVRRARKHTLSAFAFEIDANEINQEHKLDN